MKPYTVNPQAEEQYLHLHFRGQVSAQDVKQALEHASEFLGAREWTRLLIDCTESTSQLPTIDLYDLASQSIHLLRRNTRVALVAAPVRASDASFVENVTRNRGLQLTAFVDAVEARAWLKGKHFSK